MAPGEEHLAQLRGVALPAPPSGTGYARRRALAVDGHGAPRRARPAVDRWRRRWRPARSGRPARRESTSRTIGDHARQVAGDDRRARGQRLEQLVGRRMGRWFGVVGWICSRPSTSADAVQRQQVGPQPRPGGYPARVRGLADHRGQPIAHRPETEQHQHCVGDREDRLRPLDAALGRRPGQSTTGVPRRPAPAARESGRGAAPRRRWRRAPDPLRMTVGRGTRNWSTSRSA